MNALRHIYIQSPVFSHSFSAATLPNRHNYALHYLWLFARSHLLEVHTVACTADLLLLLLDTDCITLSVKLWDRLWKNIQLLETHKQTSGGVILAAVRGRLNSLHVQNFVNVFFLHNPFVRFSESA